VKLRSLAVVVPCLLAAASLAACSSGGPRIALYSDSLGAQAKPFLEDQLSGEARVRGAAVPGAALCDSLPAIATDLDGAKPRLAVIQFSGNNITPCMQGQDGEPLEGGALVEKYEADARFAVEALVNEDVPVLLVSSPPTTVSDNSTRINEVFREIAEEYRANGADVSYVDAAPSVTGPAGEFQETLPCLPFETPELGCDNGQITVRAPDGVHFCPTMSGEDPECPVWSSGAYRFATAIAGPILTALDADRTTTTPDVDDLNGRASR
jgi:hypothetical protein